MRKISSIVNTSIFQAQILTEVIQQILTKCENLVKLIVKGAQEDNSATGYLKWIVNADHLAHETLYNIDVTGENARISDPDSNFGNSSSLGDIYKCIKNFVLNEILYEDYIRTMALRYNNDDKEENLIKLESICYKTHVQVFLHVIDILKLIEYLNFKTPSLSLLLHFLNDRSVLATLSGVYTSI